MSFIFAWQWDVSFPNYPSFITNRSLNNCTADYLSLDSCPCRENNVLAHGGPNLSWNGNPIWSHNTLFQVILIMKIPALVFLPCGISIDVLETSGTLYLQRYNYHIQWCFHQLPQKIQPSLKWMHNPFKSYWGTM